MQPHRRTPKCAEHDQPKPRARVPGTQLSLCGSLEQAELGLATWLPGQWGVELPGKVPEDVLWDGNLYPVLNDG